MKWNIDFLTTWNDGSNFPLKLLTKVYRKLFSKKESDALLLNAASLSDIFSHYLTQHLYVKKIFWNCKCQIKPAYIDHGILDRSFFTDYE